MNTGISHEKANPEPPGGLKKRLKKLIMIGEIMEASPHLCTIFLFD